MQKMTDFLSGNLCRQWHPRGQEIIYIYLKQYLQGENVQFLNNTKVMWGDRNPSIKSIGYGQGGVAPHAATVRATYTTPAGKKSQLGGIFHYLEIITVAASASQRECYSQLTPNGGAAYNIAMATLNTNSNTIGQSSTVAVSLQSIMLTGDAVSLITVDTSTGGTVQYITSLQIVEYDI